MAIAQNFNNGFGRVLADSPYEGRIQSGTVASLRELVHLGRRPVTYCPVHWEDGEDVKAWVQDATTSVYEGAGGFRTLF